MIIASAWLGFQSQLCLVQLKTNETDLQPIRNSVPQFICLAQTGAYSRAKHLHGNGMYVFAVRLPVAQSLCN